MKRRRPRLALLALLLALAAAIYSGWWFWLASEVRANVDGWVAAMQLNGGNATYETLSVGGFPGRIGIDLTVIDVAGPEGSWRVQVPALRAQLTPWAIGSLHGTFDGPLLVSLLKGAMAGRYMISAGSNEFSADSDGGGRIGARLSGVRAVREESGDVLAAETLSLTLARGTAPVYGQISFDAGNADLPAIMNSTFGDRVARLRVVADLTGAVPPAGIAPQALRRWSVDGGAVDIRTLDVAHGVLGLTGEGTLALDGDLQPIGAFTAKIAGFSEAIDALVNAGAARREDGALAKIVLGVLAKSPAGGGPKQVSLPLTLQDRQLSVGPIKLLRVRRVEWE